MRHSKIVSVVLAVILFLLPACQGVPSSLEASGSEPGRAELSFSLPELPAPSIVSASGMEPQETLGGQYANVRDFGAQGDARYHYPLGKRGGETDPSQYTGWFWTGHFVRLVVADYYEKYKGADSGEYVDVYQVIPDSAVPSEKQVRLSEINPGPNYQPEAGDLVVRYTAADEKKSVYATDDSAAFEEALKQGNGCLYLPEGDYMISQLTAAKIQDISGPGRIWLKEWWGGVLWYLIYGWSELLEYQGYGWIDAEHFHNETWRSMHWVTVKPEVNGYRSSADFTEDKDSPCIEYLFDETRDNVNVWLTIAPVVPEEQFPEEITICVGSDLAAYYSLKGETEWRRATSGGVEGALYHSSWSGSGRGLPEENWVDKGEWTEITVPKESFFSPVEGVETNIWYLHCWSAENSSLLGQSVEFTKSCARVWVKDPSMDHFLICAVGGDMRSPYWKRPTNEYYIHEAYRGGDRYLTSQPQSFCAYNVKDECFDQYFPAG